MTSSRRFDRLLQAGCLGLIGMLAAAGCGGSSGSDKSKDAGDGGTPDLPPASGGALLTVTPPSVDLGSIDVGKKSDPVVVTVTNSGNVASGPLSVTVSGAGITATGCSGVSLAKGAKCEISITAQSAVAGSISGSVEVGDTPTTTKKIAVSGIVTIPGLFSLSTNALNLGNVLAGKPVSDAVVVTNMATTGLTGFVFAVSGTGFAQAGCTESLAVGATCTITVTYTAGTVSGPAKGSLTVSQGGVTKIVALTANVQKPAQLVMTPVTAAMQTVFGTQSDPPVTFYVANAGDVTSAIPTVTLSGTNKEDFVILSNGCATALLGGATSSCQISVAYKPTKAATTTSSADLVVAEPAGGSSAKATLTGTAVLPSSLAITGTSDFGTVIVGDTSTALTFTVTNNGGDNSGAIKVSSAAPFAIATDNCSDKNLAAKGTCTFTAVFKPSATDIGVVQGQLKATGASVANPAVLVVSGAGVPQAKLTAEPKVLEFGSIPTMQESAPLTLTVANVGGAPTGALKVDNTGAQFAIKGNTCTGASLTATGTTKTCYIIVTYTPTTAVSDASGTVTITDTTGAAAPVTATLHGAGMVHASLYLSPSIVCPQYDEDDALCNPLVSGSHHAAEPRFVNKVIGQTTDEMQFLLYNDTDPKDAPDSGDLTFKIEGEAAADFAIVKNNCTAPLVSTGGTPTSCIVTVTFKPSAAGLRKALLKLSTSRGGTAQATLEGKGLPVLEVQALQVTRTHTGLDFGQVALGHNDALKNSHPYRIWVRDTTSADKNTTVTVTLPKPNPADFVWPTSAVLLTITNGEGPTNGIGLLTPPLSDTDTIIYSGNSATYTSNSATNPCDNKIVSFAVGADKKPTSATEAGNAPYKYDQDSGYWFCDFGVEFYPQSARGALTADLSGAASGGGTSKITLTGTATGPLVINPSPALLQDPVAVGMSALSNLTLTISNQGAVDQKGLTFALSGTGSGDFQIVGTNCWGVNSYPPAHAYEDLLAVTLGAGEECNVWLGFEPKTEGPYSVTFTATAANGTGTTDDESATTTIIANGSKTFGALTVTAAGPFADVAYKNVNAAPVTFTVKNNGTLDATNFTYTAVGDSTAADFTVLPSVGVAGACSTASSFVLAGGASCTIQVRPTPTGDPAGIGKKLVTGKLTVDSTPGGAVVVPMTYYETSSIMVANGGSPASSVSFTFDPAGLNSLVDQSFVVSNLGSSAVSLAASVAAPFLVRESVTGLTPPCCAFGTNSLAAGATCTLVVRNTNSNAVVIPTEDPVVVKITDGTDANQANIRLSSTTLTASNLKTYGIAQNATDNRINLGSVPIDSSTATFVGGKATVWFRNEGQVATKALSFRWDLTAPTSTTGIAGTADPEFIIDSDETSCVGKALAPNAMCSMSIHFKPNTAQRASLSAREITLVLIDSDPAGVPVYLTATPVATASVYVEDVTATKVGFFQFTQTTPKDGTLVSPEIRTFRITKATSGGTVDVAPATTGVFTVSSTEPTDSCGTGKTLSATDPSCQFNVVFVPTSTANVFQYGTIEPASGVVLGLMGRVQQPVTLAIQQPVTSGVCDTNCVDFGIVAVGGTKTQALTVVNLGDVAMDPNAAALTASVTAGDPGASFTTTGGDLCTGVRLKAYGTAGDRCVMTVTATGTAGKNTSTATLNVGTATYGMSADVYKAANAIITGNNVFTNAAVTGYTTETFTITNGDDTTSYVPTGVVTASLTGAQADQFTIVGNTCPPNVGLDSGKTCEVTVRFTPKMLSSSGNAFTATLNVAATPGGPKTTTLQGTPVSALTISPAGAGTDVPATYTLGSTAVGITFTVTKAANAVATAPLKTSITGTDYMLVDDLCYGKILSGSGSESSCKFTVKYIGRSTSTEKKATISVNGGSEGQSVGIIVSHTGDEAATH